MSDRSRPATVLMIAAVIAVLVAWSFMAASPAGDPAPARPWVPQTVAPPVTTEIDGDG